MDNIVRAKEILAEAAKGRMTDEQRSSYAVELAGLLLKESTRQQNYSERKQQQQIARMMEDPFGKSFTTDLTDQCFRSSDPYRIADQILFLIREHGFPRFLTLSKRLQFLFFYWLGRPLAPLLVPFIRNAIRKETASVILPGEAESLVRHIRQRHKQGVSVNLNHLGEAILGEKEAERRFQIYLSDLSNPQVDYISIKISTICSQVNLLAWEDTLSIIIGRLKTLYRAARDHTFDHSPKFVNLDMEEYRDLHLTLEAFRRVLDEEEFLQFSAGIVLQSYLPDAYPLQLELTKWAMQRIEKGGAPIKLRIVKGANLGMERVEASMRGWPQAPYMTKDEVDANFKRMIQFGCHPEHARAVHIGVASHNLFDIAYALILRSELHVESEVSFEMLEGMADHMRRVVQELTGDILLYCPAATQEEFLYAVSYLMRRLDENTAQNNFLRHLFGLQLHTPVWNQQVERFQTACRDSLSVGSEPRRTQNRALPAEKPPSFSSFTNEPDTDWSLPRNRLWIESVLDTWKKKKVDPILIFKGSVDSILETARQAQKWWGSTSVQERSRLLGEAAQKLREHRGNLIGAMLLETEKIVTEGDIEVSEAIDFAEYYRRIAEEFYHLEDIHWRPHGTVLVAPPWNFPCSIPAGGVFAALAAGNCVLFKPPPEAVFVGWTLVNTLWEAGISREVLQFIPCADEPTGSQLVRDHRVNAIVLTGGTATAQLMLRLRPGLKLIAETGGKNCIIVTRMADRDLAVRDIVQSAFGHAGQKCSACSLVICEKEVYHDLKFRQQLVDAASSLRLGSAWDLSTRLNPLIRPPNFPLKRGLTELEPGEEWLLKPAHLTIHPNLWSPGIKLGAQPGGFTHQTELFGPVLGIMSADNLEHAVRLVNSTPYGLTSGLHSLDKREQKYWISHIEAGNGYINRGITGAIVQRQPFGGCKASSFGPGSKAGGPNYVAQLMIPEPISLPKTITETLALPPAVSAIHNHLADHSGWGAALSKIWTDSIQSYVFFWKEYFSKEHDPNCILGQDNIFYYVPQKYLTVRVQHSDSLLDIMRVIAAATICGTSLAISGVPQDMLQAPWRQFAPNIHLVSESEIELIDRIKQQKINRLRLISKPSAELQLAISEAACNTVLAPVLANGRLELLHYLREVSLSIDYHRYGNLGARETENRKPIVCEPTSCHEGPCCCK